MIVASFADIAVALKIQANELARAVEIMEPTAVAIGLSDGALGRVVYEMRRQAELIGAAHALIKVLIPVEPEVLLLAARLRAAA